MASARRLLALAAVIAAALCWAGTGAAEFRDYLLGPATIDTQVEPDGSLDVREAIEFNFLGTFTGAYRDIPLRKGESIDHISVTDTGLGMGGSFSSGGGGGGGSGGGGAW